MMKRWQKMLVGVSISVLFFVFCVGYAAVNDDLNIFGFLNMEGQSNTVLDAGQPFHAVLNECTDVQTVIFDTRLSQSTALQSMGMEWESGTFVDEGNNGDIRLFYHAQSKTAYILAQENVDITANPDASGMFAGITTLETIWFNRFFTGSTKNFDSMFEGCSNLQTVYAAKDFEVTALESANNMFAGCYALSGGYGTRVYPLGSTETGQPLDASYAKIDTVGTPGYFTNRTSVQLVHFRSNLLKDKSEAAQYTVKGSSVELTLSNALDSSTYSDTTVRYQLACYVPDGDGWKLSTSSFIGGGPLSGGSYQTVKQTVSVQTVNGVVYNRIKVVANCLSGQMESLEAVFTFDTAPHSASWRFENGVIYLQISTGTEGGQYTFTWEDGITADRSDPNQIFTAAEPGVRNLTADLQSWSSYEFCFFVTDADLLTALTAGTSQPEGLVQCTRP